MEEPRNAVNFPRGPPSKRLDRPHLVLHVAETDALGSGGQRVAVVSSRSYLPARSTNTSTTRPDRSIRGRSSRHVSLRAPRKRLIRYRPFSTTLSPPLSLLPVVNKLQQFTPRKWPAVKVDVEMETKVKEKR